MSRSTAFWSGLPSGPTPGTRDARNVALPITPTHKLPACERRAPAGVGPETGDGVGCRAGPRPSVSVTAARFVPSWRRGREHYVAPVEPLSAHAFDIRVPTSRKAPASPTGTCGAVRQRGSSAPVISPRCPRNDRPYRTIERPNVQGTVLYPKRLTGLDEDRWLEIEPVDLADERQPLRLRLIRHRVSMAVDGRLC